MKERTLNQALSENGYVYSIGCRKCGMPLGFEDEDIKFTEGRKLAESEWEFQGYVECPACGERTLVQVDRADILHRWTSAKFYTTYRNNKVFS